MKIDPFKLERYFAKYEFKAPWLFSCSDCEALTMEELLEMADPECLGLWQNLKLSYTESLGHPLLREAITGLYEKIRISDLLVTVPEEGIYIAMQTLLEPDDHVVVTFPGYQSLYQIALSLGCHVSRWKPVHHEGWHFSYEDLEALVRDTTKMIVINFPHNPTGATIDQVTLDKIVALAEEKDILLFSDEMYRGLEHDAGSRLGSVADMTLNGVTLSGMSKTYALPGLRIGWLATRNVRLMQKFAVYKDYTSICSSGPSEILALMGLRAKEVILERNLQLIRSNLDHLDSFFESRKDRFSWHRPVAGPIGFPVLTSELNVDQLAGDLIKDRGLMILPAVHYDFEVNGFRIGFARKNMPQVLKLFEDYVDCYR